MYNVEKYVGEAIASVLFQRYGDFELIIVNDGSTDASLKIAEGYAAEDLRISIIDQHNKGLGAARNVGVQLARGEYIYFFDSDDILEPDALSTCIDLIQQNSLDLIVFSGSVFPALSEMAAKFCYQKPDFLSPLEGQQLFNLLNQCGSYSPSACLYIFAKTLLNDYDLRFDEGVLHEDEGFTAQLYCLSRSSIALKNQFFRRRLRNNSIMTSPRTVSNVVGYIQAAVTIGKFIRQSDFLCKASCNVLRAKQRTMLKIAARISEDIGENKVFSALVQSRFSMKELVRIDSLILFYSRSYFFYNKLRMLKKTLMPIAE